VTQTRLLAIEREDLLMALTGHSDAGRTADEMTDRRLPDAP